MASRQAKFWAVSATVVVNRYAAEMGCGQPPPGEDGGAKKYGGPLWKIVRTGLVCVVTRLYSRRPQSINARSVWAQTRHNSRESIGILDALIMYAVRIVKIDTLFQTEKRETKLIDLLI